MAELKIESQWLNVVLTLTVLRFSLDKFELISLVLNAHFGRLFIQCNSFPQLNAITFLDNTEQKHLKFY